MIDIFDPLDSGNEYGLILYEYQRTASIIQNILTDMYNGDDSRVDKLPQLFRLHNKQMNDFFEGKDHEELLKQYARSCSEHSMTHRAMIDIGLNRMN